MNDWQDAEQHVERAHEHYEAGRWDEAVAELRRALALNPYQAEWHFNLGLTLEAAGRYADAATSFGEAFTLDPEDGQIAVMTGTNLLRANQIEPAIGWFERAATMDPKDPMPFVHRIEAYARLGRFDQAELMYFMGQQVDGDEASLYAAMAEALMDQRQYERAVWCLREAARLEPQMPRVEARLAEAYAATGRHERARQLYLRELRHDPGDIETLLDLGCLLTDMHRVQEAGEKFRRVLEIEPDNAEAHFRLGELAEKSGTEGEAIAQYDIVMRLDASFPGVRRRMAALMLARGQEEDLALARRLAEEEFAVAREEGLVGEFRDIEAFGCLLLDTKLVKEAVVTFRSLAQRCPEESRAWHLLSVACLESHAMDEGMEHARRAVRMEPTLVAAMHNLAMAHLQLGNWRRARYWVRHALRVSPDDAPLRRLRVRLNLHSIGELFVGAWQVVVRRRPKWTS